MRDEMSLSTKPALLTTDANLEQKVILDCVLKINLHTSITPDRYLSRYQNKTSLLSKMSLSVA